MSFKDISHYACVLLRRTGEVQRLAASAKLCHFLEKKSYQRINNFWKLLPWFAILVRYLFQFWKQPHFKTITIKMVYVARPVFCPKTQLRKSLPFLGTGREYLESCGELFFDLFVEDILLCRFNRLHVRRMNSRNLPFIGHVTAISRFLWEMRACYEQDCRWRCLCSISRFWVVGQMVLRMRLTCPCRVRWYLNITPYNPWRYIDRLASKLVPAIQCTVKRVEHKPGNCFRVL